MSRRQAKKVLRCGWCCTHNVGQLDQAERVLRRVLGSMPAPAAPAARWGRWDWRTAAQAAAWGSGDVFSGVEAGQPVWDSI